MKGAAVPILALLAASVGHAQTMDADRLIRAFQAQDQAVESVGYRLATANADLCIGAKPDPGFLVQTLGQYDPAYRDAASRVLDLQGWPGVTAVAAGAPAEAAGLRVGDAVTAVNGIALPHRDTPNRAADYEPTEIAQYLLAAGFTRGRATLSLLRDGRTVTIDMPAAAACPAAFEVVPADRTNSGADGVRVQISSRMVALTTNDTDLAAVLAHELAHNVLRHRLRLDMLHVSRGLLGQFGRNAALIRQTETEADRLGIYLLARAGYSPEAALDFWRRLSATVHTWGDATHPSWKARLAILQAEADRIQATGQRGRTIELPEDLKRLIPTTP